METFYITYEEAERMKPVLEHFSRHGPQKPVREAAFRLLREIRFVRDIDYSPLSGHQLWLKGTDAEVLREVLGILGEVDE